MSSPSLNYSNTNIGSNSIIDNPVFKLKLIPLDNKLEEPYSNNPDSNSKNNYTIGDTIVTKNNIKGKILSVNIDEESLVILDKKNNKIKVDFSYIKNKLDNKTINTNLNFVTEFKNILTFNDFLLLS